MAHHKITAGILTYWELVSFYDRDKVRSGWNALGFDKFVPDQRSPLACLKDALLDATSDRDTLVRPLQASNGYSVVREHRGQDENSYVPLFNARIPVGLDYPVFSTAGEVVEKVEELYRKHRRLITGAQMSGKLVDIAYHLNGTRLRRNGGLYWLSEDKGDDWDMATTVMVESGDTPGSQLHLISHEMTPRAVLAVRDGLVHDIQTRVKHLHDEITSGEMGQRGLEARQKEILQLQAKAKEYEVMLDISLGDLRKGLDDLGQAAATASLVLLCEPATPASQQEVVMGGH